MLRYTQSIVVVLCFILRIGIPLLVTMGVGTLVRGLGLRRSQVAAGELAVASAGVGLAASTVERQPCWLVKHCSEEGFLNCPAYANTAIPCWAARLRGQGRVPRICANCELFEECFGRS